MKRTFVCRGGRMVEIDPRELPKHGLDDSERINATGRLGERVLRGYRDAEARYGNVRTDFTPKFIKKLWDDQRGFD